MAWSDTASVIRVFSKSWLPGVGYDSSGNAKQNKIRVTGEIRSDLDNTIAAGVNTFSIAKLGLSNVDSASFVLAEINGATALSATAANNRILLADVGKSTAGKITLLLTDIVTPTLQAVTAAVVRFDVTGDALTAPELNRIGAA